MPPATNPEPKGAAVVWCMTVVGFCFKWLKFQEFNIFYMDLDINTGGIVIALLHFLKVQSR